MHYLNEGILLYCCHHRNDSLLVAAIVVSYLHVEEEAPQLRVEEKKRLKIYFSLFIQLPSTNSSSIARSNASPVSTL